MFFASAAHATCYNHCSGVGAVRENSPVRSILAGFRSRENAVRAKRLLEAEGYTEVQVDDDIGLFPDRENQEVIHPLTGNIPSLARLTMGMSGSSRDATVMAAAHPDASGLADQGEVGPGVLLTVVTDEAGASRAEEIIRQCGGEI